MPWFKIDDKHHDHRKTRRALRAGKAKRRDAAAIGLWCLAGSWSADNLMDGFVPTDELLRWDDDGETLAEMLVEAEFWEPTERDGEPGFQFINWDEHQPTKADVEAKREAARERMRAARNKGGKVSSREQDANVRANNPRSSREVRSTPSRPVPTRPDPEVVVVADAPTPPSTQLALVPNDRPDVERICQHLAERIEANGSKRPSVTKGWRDAARLMLDADGRTEDEIHGAIAWCQADEFWRSNVLSLPKLRQKFDTLRLQAQRPAGSTGRRNDIDWDVAMDRARAMGGQQ